jgi:hypothetical protein
LAVDLAAAVLAVAVLAAAEDLTAAAAAGDVVKE